MFEKDLLAGKRILVTGGGSGLGAAMGRRFLELGAELLICGRRLELLEATAAQMRGDTGGAVVLTRPEDSEKIYFLQRSAGAEGRSPNQPTNASCSRSKAIQRWPREPRSVASISARGVERPPVM